MCNDSNQRGGSGMADEREKETEAGRKGGQQSHQGSGQSDKSKQDDSRTPGGQQRGGSGNFANDPDRTGEAGRKGGEHSEDRR